MLVKYAANVFLFVAASLIPSNSRLLPLLSVNGTCITSRGDQDENPGERLLNNFGIPRKGLYLSYPRCLGGLTRCSSTQKADM